MKVEFNIIPTPASRPRVTRWSTYYGKKYTKFRSSYNRTNREKKI